MLLLKSSFFKVEKDYRFSTYKITRDDSHLLGFTLLELLAVVAMVGIIAAIAAPGWLSFSEAIRLTGARDKIHVGIKDAQDKAKSRSTVWQYSLRDRDGVLEWAEHSATIPPALAQWESLDIRSVRIDEETTFAKSGDVYYVRFDEKGNVQYRLGRITLSGSRFSENKRCVIVSTLIGTTRKAKEKKKPRDGKSCY